MWRPRQARVSNEDETLDAVQTEGPTTSEPIPAGSSPEPAISNVNAAGSPLPDTPHNFPNMHSEPLPGLQVSLFQITSSYSVCTVQV